MKLVLALWLASIASATAAQASSAHVGVLRSTDAASASLADPIDAALLRDLHAVAGIEDPFVSPVDYGEIQLSVGCSDESRACLETIARAASVSALLVRVLRTAEDGSVRLELRYFDSASTDPPAAVNGEVAAGAGDALVAAVPSLVRELFGIPEVAEPAAVQPAPAPRAAPAQAPREEDDGPAVLPWVVIGVGAAVLTAGIVVGAVAASDYDAWKERPIRSLAEADRANAELDELEDRALLANVLIPAGIVAAGVGVALLVLDGSADVDEDRASLDVEPVAGGALVSLRAPW